jgi:hypothetical protein
MVPGMPPSPLGNEALRYLDGRVRRSVWGGAVRPYGRRASFAYRRGAASGYEGL